MLDAAEYLRQAEEAQRHAKLIQFQPHRELMLEMARQLRELAARLSSWRSARPNRGFYSTPLPAVHND